MKFNLDETIEVLSRTHVLLKVLLNDLSHDWVHNNAGPETWSPYDVVGHLIHGEKTDWADCTNNGETTMRKSVRGKNIY